MTPVNTKLYYKLIWHAGPANANTPKEKYYGKKLLGAIPHEAPERKMNVCRTLSTADTR